MSVAATNTLRAAAWGSDVPILPAPDWAKASKAVYSTTALPFEVRESLSNLSTSGATTLYEVEDLALLGSAGDADDPARFIVSSSFQGLPFFDSVTHLTYVRARWLNHTTGQFLTVDPFGYRDSGNLYAFGAGDPVNNGDPRGELCDRKKRESLWDYGKRCAQEGFAETKKQGAHVLGGGLGVVVTGAQIVHGIALIFLDPPGDDFYRDPRDREFHRQHYDALKRGLLHPIDTFKENWAESRKATEDAEQKGEYLRAGYLAGNFGSQTGLEVIGAAEGGIGLVRLGTGIANRVAATATAARRANFQLRQGGMLSADAGYNLSPEATFSTYPAIGASGTFITDEAGVLGTLGTASSAQYGVGLFSRYDMSIFARRSQISYWRAWQIERALGLERGSLAAMALS